MDTDEIEDSVLRVVRLYPDYEEYGIEGTSVCAVLSSVDSSRILLALHRLADQQKLVRWRPTSTGAYCYADASKFKGDVYEYFS